MTVDVDTDTFYAAGGRLFELAGEVYDAFAVNAAILGGTGAMAGTDDAGTAWATSYDGRAREVLSAVNDLTLAMQNYGGVVVQAGYNHAVAEYNATAGHRGEPPQRSPEPAGTADVLSAPPSVGGPGKGLFDNALGLVEQVEALEVNARAFSDTHSPEVEFIVRDLGELRDATAAILDGCRELAQSCKDYQAALDDLRDQLEDILTELAIDATILIFAAAVSFGAGAVAGTAKAAHTISRFAGMIRSAVSAWKLSKRISQVGKHAEDYGLNPNDADARDWVRHHIEDIFNNPDEIRQGVYHPQTGGGANFWFYRRGDDIVITKENGDFVSIFKNGADSDWFDKAAPR